MSDGPWWARSPIIIVPLAAFALGLAFVPFAIGTVDHAAEFYGAFVAAIVAAGAVVGTTALQAKLTRQQRYEERREEMLAEALELYAWMNSLAIEINYVALVIERWISISPPPIIRANNLRSNVAVDTRTRLRNRLIVASRLPQPFGHHIVDTLHRTDSILDTIAYVPMLPDDAPFSLEELQNRQRFATYFTRLVSWHRARLGEYLVSQAVIKSIGAEERAVLAAGIPSYTP